MTDKLYILNVTWGGLSSEQYFKWDAYRLASYRGPEYNVTLGIQVQSGIAIVKLTCNILRAWSKTDLVSVA